jgi:hypothetical protein
MVTRIDKFLNSGLVLSMEKGCTNVIRAAPVFLSSISFDCGFHHELKKPVPM